MSTPVLYCNYYFYSPSFKLYFTVIQLSQRWKYPEKLFSFAKLLIIYRWFVEPSPYFHLIRKTEKRYFTFLDILDL